MFISIALNQDKLGRSTETEVASLENVVRESVCKEMSRDQKPEGNEEGSHVDI